MPQFPSPADAKAAIAPALRPVQPADEAVLRRIFASTRADDLACMPLTDSQKQQLLDMQFRAQDGQYRRDYAQASFDLLLVAGEVAGRLYLDRSEDAILLIDISLLPQYRGSGLGSAVLRALQDEATAGGRSIELNVMRTNRALRLYQRLGFVVTADSGVYYSMQWDCVRQPGTAAARDRTPAVEFQGAQL